LADQERSSCPGETRRAKRDLDDDFKHLCQRNRDGSFAAQHDRESILTLLANQLEEDGFRHLRATGVRSKHVEHLVERWHAEGISAGTFKNRMLALRWLAEKIDKRNIVARDNAAYGLGHHRPCDRPPNRRGAPAWRGGWQHRSKHQQAFWAWGYS